MGKHRGEVLRTVTWHKKGACASNQHTPPGKCSPPPRELSGSPVRPKLSTPRLTVVRVRPKLSGDNYPGGGKNLMGEPLLYLKPRRWARLPAPLSYLCRITDPMLNGTRAGFFLRSDPPPPGGVPPRPLWVRPTAGGKKGVIFLVENFWTPILGFPGTPPPGGVVPPTPWVDPGRNPLPGLKKRSLQPGPRPPALRPHPRPIGFRHQGEVPPSTIGAQQ